MKYTEVAKKAPHCMSCQLPNPDGNMLCLAHRNLNQWGSTSGQGKKSEDVCGAFLCKLKCHPYGDGEGRWDWEWWGRAIHRSQTWAAANGYLVVGDGK